MNARRCLQVAPAIFGLILAGCTGTRIDARNAASFVDAFVAGRVQLKRNNPFALPSPRYRRHVYDLWIRRQWSYLASDVTENGYDMDLNWFYLGEAAKGQGFFEAAKVYYGRANEDAYSYDANRRCSSFRAIDPWFCAYFSFPRDLVRNLR